MCGPCKGGRRETGARCSRGKETRAGKHMGELHQWAALQKWTSSIDSGDEGGKKDKLVGESKVRGGDKEWTLWIR